MVEFVRDKPSKSGSQCMNEHENNIEMHIFCDGAMNKVIHKLGREGDILAMLSKYKNRDSLLMTEILAVKATLELAC